MFKTEIKDGRAPQRLSFFQMKDGQIGRITDAPMSEYIGDTVLRVYNDVVSLTTIGRVWGKHADIEVELLPVGATVTLTVTSNG